MELEMSDKSKKDMDIARKIWLAGIGAYGRAVDDATEAYAKVGKETTKIFEDLVGKGEELEGAVATVAKSVVPEMAQKQRAQVEDRMERMKAALGLGEVAADQQEHIENIESRLDAIEAKLDAVLAAVAKPKAAPRARAKKPAVKKPAVKK
jgi:hypothetical protein